MDARRSVSPASSGQELFDFFELFGDPSSTAAASNNITLSNEALLSGDDQLMFASFLDAFDAGGPAPTPSLDLFGNVVGASDLLSLTASSTSSAASSTLSSGIRSLDSRFSPVPQPSPGSDSLTIPVLSSAFTAPHEHKSALFPLHNPSNPFAAQQQQSNHAEDTFEDQLSGSLPKRMKSNNTASTPAQPFNFLNFYQQQLAAAQLIVQQAQQAQQHVQHQQHQLPLPQQLLHQLQQSQHHNLQHQQRHHDQHQQPPPPQNRMDPYAKNMMPPLSSFQSLTHHDPASQPLSSPSPPPTACLHSTSTLLTAAVSSSSLSSAPSLSNTIGSANSNSTIPKKRGRKPKDTVKADPDGAIPTSNPAAISTSSSSTKTNKPLLSASEKKTNHIQAEQRRRAQIRDALRELSQIVPGLLPPIDGDTTVEGSSRVEILEGTRRYVEVLREGNARLRRLMEA